MKTQKIYFLFLISLILTSAQLLADDQIIVVRPDKNIFRLEEKKGMLGTSFNWVWVGSPKGSHDFDEDLSKQTEFLKPDNEYQSAGGRIQIVNDRQINVDRGGGFKDAGFPAPAHGETYKNAHIDKMGNIFVEVGGTGKGYVFKNANGTIIPSEKLEWGQSVKQIIPNPSGQGFIALNNSGQGYRLIPPVDASKRFFWEKIENIVHGDVLIPFKDKLFFSKYDTLQEIIGLDKANVNSIKPSKAIPLPGYRMGVVENRFFSSSQPQAIKAIKEFVTTDRYEAALKAQAALAAQKIPPVEAPKPVAHDLPPVEAPKPIAHDVPHVEAPKSETFLYGGKTPGQLVRVTVDMEKKTLEIVVSGGGKPEAIKIFHLSSAGPFIFPAPTPSSNPTPRVFPDLIELDNKKFVEKLKDHNVFAYRDLSKRDGFSNYSFDLTDNGIKELPPVHRLQDTPQWKSPDITADSELPVRKDRSQRASDVRTAEAGASTSDATPAKPGASASGAAPAKTVAPSGSREVIDRSIKNPTYREHLKTLPSRLSNLVIGQDEPIHAIANAFEARATLPITKGTNLLLLGPTGTGKTETAKAIAKEHYLNEKAFTSFNMGEFKKDGDLNNLFGSAKGYIGSESAPPFEQFLIDHPNGGVMLFDEVGNMGADAKIRNSMLKQFYQILDEGSWKNRDGKIYDLKDYTLIFASNEGQEVFDGLATDASRTKAWAYNNSPDKLAQILRNNGWPEALIPRFEGNIFLYKPLVLKDRAVIAKNFASSLAKTIEKEHGVKVTFSPKFYDKVADTFFSHRQGVRQMKIPTVTDLASLVGKEVSQLYEKPEQLSKTELVIDLDDLSEKNPEGGAPKRSVLLKVTSKTEGLPEKVASLDLTAKAPIRILERSIKNPEYREHLTTLQPRLEKRVIGQPEAVKSVFSSINSRAAVPTQKPVSLLFLGPTGTGKTELAKAVAAEEFLDKDAFVSFNLGEVKNEAGLNNIFGSAKGYIGGEDVPPFQQFLDFHPNGGVILFDEIGNMGNDAASRNSLIKYFYNMLDEGVWKNRDGKIIDLSKYVLAFGSNEGEEVFQGLTSDKSRMSAWEANKAPEKIQKILKKSGWSEAAIARFDGNITMFKPLVSKERALIAKNFADGVAKKIHQAHGVDVTFADNFYKKAADNFFSHTQGIRQLKAATTTELSNLIGENLITLYEKPELLPNTKLVIDVNEVVEKGADGGQPKRKVFLKLTAHTPGHPDKVISSDLTSKAEVKPIISKKENIRTAINKAGQAIANDPMKSGLYTKDITIVGEGNKAGEVTTEKVPNFRQALTREAAVSRIAMDYAGGIAEEMYFPEEPLGNGRMADLERARKTAQEVVDGGMGLKGSHLTSAQQTEEISSLLKEGEELARKLLKERWPAVRTVAARLMSQGTLNQGEFEGAIKATGVKMQQGLVKTGEVKPYVNRNPKCPSLFGSLFTNFGAP